MDLKPSVTDLTEMHTLEFDLGDTITLPKAKLLLCGEDLKEQFQLNIKGELIPLKHISLNAFLGILEEVETGKRSDAINKELYEIACDALDFHSQIIPEGTLIFGAEQYKTRRNIDVLDSPEIPQHLIDILNGPCPDSDPEKGLMGWQTQMLILYRDGTELVETGKNAHQYIDGVTEESGYAHISPKIIMDRNTPIKGTYWGLRYLGNIEGSEDKSRAVQLGMSTEAPGNPKGPLTIEDVEFQYAHKALTGKWHNEKTYTCCQDQPIPGFSTKVAVGACLSGLDVSEGIGGSNVRAGRLRK